MAKKSGWTRRAKDIAKQSVDFGARTTKGTVVFLGILAFVLTAVFIVTFVGSYELFWIAVSDNLLIAITMFVLGSILAGSFFSSIIFAIIPEPTITNIAAALHIPFEILLVLILIVLSIIFSALSAISFFGIGIVCFGAGLIIRIFMKKISRWDLVPGVILVLSALGAFIPQNLIGMVFGAILLLMGIGYIVPIEK